MFNERTENYIDKQIKNSPGWKLFWKEGFIEPKAGRKGPGPGQEVSATSTGQAEKADMCSAWRWRRCGGKDSEVVWKAFALAVGRLGGEGEAGRPSWVVPACKEGADTGWLWGAVGKPGHWQDVAEGDATSSAQAGVRAVCWEWVHSLDWFLSLSRSLYFI